MSERTVGWLVDGAYVCIPCVDAEEVESALRQSERTASGKICSRCSQLVPYLVRVEVLPDGYYSIHAPTPLEQSQKVIRLMREAEVLAEQHALVRVSVGCERELGLSIGPAGKIEVWVHDDPYGDAEEPAARWEYDPASSEVEALTDDDRARLASIASNIQSTIEHGDGPFEPDGRDVQYLRRLAHGCQPTREEI